MHWILLAVSIGAEIGATLALNASAGFTRFVPSVLAVGGYAVAFVALARALTVLDAGPAYAIWSGAALVGVAVVGWLFAGERPAPLTLAGIAVVAIGTIMINIGGAGGD